jgi:hypothetical protein
VLRNSLKAAAVVWVGCAIGCGGSSSAPKPATGGNAPPAGGFQESGPSKAGKSTESIGGAKPKVD